MIYTCVLSFPIAGHLSSSEYTDVSHLVIRQRGTLPPGSVELEGTQRFSATQKLLYVTVVYKHERCQATRNNSLILLVLQFFPRRQVLLEENISDSKTEGCLNDVSLHTQHKDSVHAGKKHTVCVFTSPTLSRLSSLSSRDVVYIGS